MAYAISIGQAEQLVQKFESFGWQVYNIDGHNHDEIYKALENPTSFKTAYKAVQACPLL